MPQPNANPALIPHLIPALVLVGALCLSSANAQESTAPGFAGRTAMGFSLDLFSPSFFDTGIGGLHWMNEKIALEGSLYLGHGKSDDNWTSHGSDYGDSDDDSNTEVTKYGAGFGFRRYVWNQSKIRPFLGAMINAEHYSLKSHGTSKDDYYGEATETAKSTSWLMGAMATVGAEYWFTDRLALGALYGVGVEHERGEYESDSRTYGSSSGSYSETNADVQVSQLQLTILM
ncbi:MAG: DUF3575 domain-containing protein [Candidatus Schekmanbacteria bacterium]|nr:DUF3575 domain-containing protein [Candidatus Schekmanbacteria bacterium]